MISILKFTELLSVFSFEACSLTYSFKVSFLIALLIIFSINLISYILVLALLSILLNIFSLLNLFKYASVVNTSLFFHSPDYTFITLHLSLWSYFLAIVTPAPNTALCELPKDYVGQDFMSFFCIVMLLQALWYIVPYHKGSSHPVCFSVFTIDFL